MVFLHLLQSLQSTFCFKLRISKIQLLVMWLTYPGRKNYCFRKCRWWEKSSPGWTQFFCFSRFSGYILFASLVVFFFAFFDSCFVCLFVCLFDISSNKNVYSDTHLTMRAASDKKISPCRFPKTRLIFLTLLQYFTNNILDARRTVSNYFRSSHPEMFLKECGLKICNKFTGEHPCQSAISISNFIDIETTLRQWCVPLNLVHIFRTAFL